MTLRRIALPLFLLALCWLALVPSSLGQTEAAILSGLITDPQGKVVPAVDVEVTNVDTNVSVHHATNSSGLYVVVGLKPGRYRVSVTKEGFRRIDLTDLVLNVQDVLSRNFQLQLGPVLASITVVAESANVNTTEAAVGTVIDRKFVANVPLNGRSFQDLILLTPGVVTQSPQAQSTLATAGDFSVNGQRTESNYYMIDGVTGNVSPGNGAGVPQPASAGTIGASSALGTTQSLISVDALQEFRVQSSTYSAEYGRTPGGQFSFVTRSGTNELHGSAFDYLRNDFFDANDWFNDHFGVKITPLRQNDFGGTLGGPVFVPGIYNGRNKTFFFVSYEGLRLTQPQAATIQYVPSLSIRQSAPGVLQPILNAFPLPTPTGIDFGNGLAQFIEPYSLPGRIDSTSVRLDHTFTSKLSLFFRFGDTPSSTTTRTLSAVAQNHINTQTYTLGANGQVSRTATNEFRVGYARSDSEQSSRLDSFGGAKPIDLAQAMGLGSYAAPAPFFQIFIPGVGGSILTTDTARNIGRQWNVIDTFSITSGHHQVRVGIDYRRIKSPIVPTSPFENAIWNSENSILANSADLLILVKTNGATPIFNELSAFAEDEWRIAPRLALSLGLRWEVDPPPSNEHGNDAYTLLGDINNPGALTLAPQGTQLWKTTWFNFAPRFGIALTARDHPGQETVLRGGGGVFFDTDNKVAAQGFGGVGFSAFQFFFGVPVPVTASELNFSPSAVPPYTSSLVYAFPPHLQLPYTLEWNVALEQALGRSQRISLSYVGASGRRLIQQQQRSINALNPNFGSIAFVPNGVTSNYQGLQIQFQRTISHGLHALAAYTWSHSIDFGSNEVALPVTRGNSDFDVRHSFSGGITWDLPGTVGNRVAGAFLNHWGVDGRLTARTGFPVTLEGNFLTDPATGNSFFGNVNLVPGQPIYLYGAQFPGGRAINPAAFVLPTNPNDPGGAPRNFVRGFGAWQINLAVRREFTLPESLKLQFRAEAFNVLNHPNFGNIDGALSDATFGQATQMLNQSLGTVNALYQQGGPRSMQFALKLLF